MSFEELVPKSKETVIPNKEQVEKKIAQFREKGLEGMHVLTDFDRTLTKGYLDGEKTPSIISQLRSGKYLTKAYAEQAHALFNHYHPIEIDPSISLEDRIEAMDEWWMKHFELLFASGLTLKVLQQVAQENQRIFRPGALEFLKFCKEKQVPVVIMSASLGDMIRLYLEQENLLDRNIHIVSNNFDFDKQGAVTGVQKPIVHSLNKSEVILDQLPEVHRQIEKRKNVLLMGDGLGDLGMIDGYDFDTALSIGFYNDTDPKYLEAYKQGYDWLITGDGSMEGVLNFMNTMS